jgi:hypothetical protein
MASSGDKSYGQTASKSSSGSKAASTSRTRGIGSTADYEKKGRVTSKVMDYIPSAANLAVVGKWTASEAEYNQMRDIKDAYRGYKNSPPSGGALRGLKNSEVSKGMSSKSSGSRR